MKTNICKKCCNHIPILSLRAIGGLCPLFTCVTEG